MNASIHEINYLFNKIDDFPKKSAGPCLSGATRLGGIACNLQICSCPGLFSLSRLQLSIYQSCILSSYCSGVSQLVGACQLGPGE